MVGLVAGVLLLMVLSVCLRLLWPGVGGLLVHRLWWLWFPLVAEVASGDADGVGLGDVGVVSGVGRCVGIVGDGEDGGAAGDADGEGVVLA